MSVRLDQTRMAAYGAQTADAQTVVEMAVGGKAATQIYEGERKFDVTVRYPKQNRDTERKSVNCGCPPFAAARWP